MTPGHFQPMKGPVEYKYNRAHKDCTKDGCSFSEENRLATGTFMLYPDPEGWGFLSGEGTATWNQKTDGGFSNSKCSGEDHSTLSGTVKISAESGGMASAGVLEGDQRSSQNCGAMPPTHTHWNNGGGGTSCEIANLDLVHGGTGSASVPADEGYGTCKVEVVPQ